jgi:hypothetical protein
MSTVAAHHLLGKSGEGNLILMAGPDYARIKQIVTTAGMPFQEWHEVVGVELLRAEVTRSGRSLVVIASMYEVEGRLDRSAFDGRLTDLAYEADMVVYAGRYGVALAWPEAPDSERRVNGGHIQVIAKSSLVVS